MKLQVSFSGWKPNADARHALIDRLLGSIDRFAPQVSGVAFYLQDVNGPKGGVDKECRLIVKLRQLPSIIIRDSDSCFSTLVERVTSRASHAVSKTVERRKSGRKNSFPTTSVQPLVALPPSDQTNG